MNNRSVDDVDDTMDDIRDQMDVANSISEAISTPLGNEMFDEDALDQELADLEDENIDEMINGGNKMPSVPQTSLPQKQQVEDEEDEFAALEKEMNF